MSKAILDVNQLNLSVGPIRTGRVDFPQVFSKLQKLGYQSAITIERETSGPQQMKDVMHEKTYPERVLSQLLTNQT